jgi:hypothetical protein
MKVVRSFSLSASRHLSVVTLAAIMAVSAGGCAGLNDPNYYPSSGGSYNNSYDDDYYRRREAERNWEERRRIERERDRLEEERRRLEYERDRSPPPLQRPAPQDSCPSGFTPSEQKCSPSERARGCKDVRTPSGLGCVRR